MSKSSAVKGVKQQSLIVVIILLFILFLAPGCGMHLVKSYPTSEVDPIDRANLTFTTETLGKSYGYLGLIRRLRLSIYDLQTDDISKSKSYLGTISITKEDNSQTIAIPSGKPLGLEAEFYQILLNLHTRCSIHGILKAERNKSYKLQYSKDDEKCWFSMTPVDADFRVLSKGTSTTKNDYNAAPPTIN